MIENRSVPANTVFPHVIYEDVVEAIAWLTRTFGFIEHFRYGNPVDGAQMHLGPAWIMLHSMRPGRSTPVKLGAGTQSLTIFVEEVHEHFQRTRSSGATIVEEPHETEYGELQYGTIDLAGHLWLFSKHVRDVSPEEWGAVVAGVESD